MRCSCEHESHKFDMCSGEAERVRFTNYGTFELCKSCYEMIHMKQLQSTAYQGKIYRGPSLKSLMDYLKINKNKAQEIIGLMNGTINPNTYMSVHTWKKLCHNKPSRIELLLCALDQVLGTYGVEVLESKYSSDSYWMNVRFCYLNVGDTYKPTLIYDTELDYFLIGSWGDLVESSRYGIE